MAKVHVKKQVLARLRALESDEDTIELNHLLWDLYDSGVISFEYIHYSEDAIFGRHYIREAFEELEESGDIQIEYSNWGGAGGNTIMRGEAYRLM